MRSLLSRIQHPALLHITLLSAGMWDEIISGFPVVGIPLIRDQLGLSYEQIGLLFSAGALVGMILGPIISLFSDRNSKRIWIVGGFLLGAASFLLAGSASNFPLLLIAFIVSTPANDAAIGLSQAALIDQKPDASTKTMTRWTLLSSIGDLASPIIISVFVALQFGWPQLCWLAMIIWLVLALIIWSQRFPQAPRPVEDEHQSLKRLLMTAGKALGDREMLRWSLLTLIPTMVDEIFLSFTTLYLHDHLRIDQATIGIVLAIDMSGALLGLFLLDRIPMFNKIAPHRLLTWLAILVLAGVLGLLIFPSPWLAALFLFVISIGSAGWYPIAKAQAYARFPGRSGMVRAIISLGTPLEVALPGLVGLIAGQFGLVAGIGLLGSAPLFILLLTIGLYRKEAVR